MGMAGRSFESLYTNQNDWEDVYEKSLGYTVVTADRNSLELKYFRRFSPSLLSFTFYLFGHSCLFFFGSKHLFILRCLEFN